VALGVAAFRGEREIGSVEVGVEASFFMSLLRVLIPAAVFWPLMDGDDGGGIMPGFI
jgi:hypothetical protein